MCGMDGGRPGGAGVTVEVCARGDSGIAGEESSDVFSIGAEGVHDGRSAIVFANSIGACEAVGQREIRYQ